MIDRNSGLACALCALVIAALVTGCGSASPRAAIDTPCRQVASVLSDGPDPGVDPAGYAEAQVRQLRLLKISRGPLLQDIRALASAYEAYSSTGGHNASAKEAAAHAIHVLNAACPAAGASL